MRRLFCTSGLLATLIVLLGATTTPAGEFRMFGPRAASMGGAGVARPDGACALYYNPGALGGMTDTYGLSIPVSAWVKDTGIADHLEGLTGTDWEQAVANPSGPEALTIISEILQISPADGLIAGGGGGILLHMGRVGIGAIVGGDVVEYGNIDKLRVVPTGPSDPLSFAHNQSALHARGLAMAEVPLAYGHQFPLGGSKLNIGAAVKYIQGMTFNIEQTLTTDIADVQDLLQDSDETSGAVGFDAGVQWVSSGGTLAIGVLGRNINSPEFEAALGTTFEQAAQVRAGVSVAATDWLTFALDVDLTANDTLVANYTSRQVGGGVRIAPLSWLGFAVGVMANVEADSISPVWTAGLSIGPDSLHLEIAGVVGGETKTVEDFTFPTEAGLQVSLAGNW